MMKSEDSSYRIIVMGKTGSGKSSVLNSLTKTTHFQVGDSILSETKDIQVLKVPFRNRISSPVISFIDTPGFFDSSSKDNHVIAKIAMSLKKIEDGLNLVLFCFPSYEVRMDASMQASLRFLKLVMGKAVYEHVVIVLTHGNRLTQLELENAIARMNDKFLPFLREKMKCKVKEEILVYRKDEANDGLEDVLKYITSNKKYKPKVMDDLGRFWNDEDPAGSIENLLHNSSFFKKIQDMLSKMKNEQEDLSDQMEEIKKEMEKMAKTQDLNFKSDISEVKTDMTNRFKNQQSEMEHFKYEMNTKLKSMQVQMEEKDRKISELLQGFEKQFEKRPQSRVHDSGLTNPSIAQTEQRPQTSGLNKHPFSHQEPALFLRKEEIKYTPSRVEYVPTHYKEEVASKKVQSNQPPARATPIIHKAKLVPSRSNQKVMIPKSSAAPSLVRVHKKEDSSNISTKCQTPQSAILRPSFRYIQKK